LAAVKLPGYLRRYADIPALIHLLSSKEITLLDPKAWDDRNDSYFMSIYKNRKRFSTVLALCFSQSPETYHHWRVFSSGPSGVCVVFDRKGLLQDLGRQEGVHSGSVKYLTLQKAKKRTFKVDELPFLKRYGFKPENEYRAIYTSKTKAETSLGIPLRLTSIRSISLSPWMNVALSSSTVTAIRAIDGCKKLRISRSTLISNDQWKRYAESAS
jgi:hypothetical protein